VRNGTIINDQSHHPQHNSKKNILEMCACVLFAGLQGGANLWAGDIPFAPAVLEDLDK
jgi:hypothetical protein